MAGRVGITLEAPPAGATEHGWWFGEDQARYILAVEAAAADAVIAELTKAGVPARRLGVSGGAALKLPDGASRSLEELAAAHEEWLPSYMSASAKA